MIGTVETGVQTSWISSAGAKLVTWVSTQASFDLSYQPVLASVDLD